MTNKQFNKMKSVIRGVRKNWSSHNTVANIYRNGITINTREDYKGKPIEMTYWFPTTIQFHVHTCWAKHVAPFDRDNYKTETIEIEGSVASILLRHQEYLCFGKLEQVEVWANNNSKTHDRKGIIDKTVILTFRQGKNDMVSFSFHNPEIDGDQINYGKVYIRGTEWYGDKILTHRDQGDYKPTYEDVKIEAV